jgi:hypothetical protein
VTNWRRVKKCSGSNLKLLWIISSCQQKFFRNTPRLNWPPFGWRTVAFGTFRIAIKKKVLTTSSLHSRRWWLVIWQFNFVRFFKEKCPTLFDSSATLLGTTLDDLLEEILKTFVFVVKTKTRRRN